MAERIEPVEECPPVPKQLLWMFDGIDRKEATKMMHDYAASAITWKPSKALLRAWEDVQATTDKARRLEDELKNREKIPVGLIRALQVQMQVDEDGTLVGVSRQALDELFDWNDAPYSPETPNDLGEGRERGILREASSGEAATSTDGLEGGTKGLK